MPRARSAASAPLLLLVLALGDLACSKTTQIVNASTGASGTSGGAGTTGAGSSGATTGAGSTTSSTTGAPLGPYVGYDAGPHEEPLPAADSGCTIAAPFVGSTGCVQCRNAADCPAPLTCEGTAASPLFGRCVACTAASPSCPSGTVCSDSDACEVPVDCRQDAGACIGQNGGYCDFDGGHLCVANRCLADRDCPAATPFCDPGSNFCGPCVFDAGLGHAGGCPIGQICNPDALGVVGPSCTADCRLDGGLCNPGSCNADGGFVGSYPVATIGCIFDLCLDARNCGGSLPLCDPDAGRCVQCESNADCATLGAGQPSCGAGVCGSNCDDNDGGELSCGAEQCANEPNSGKICVCASAAACAGQALAPECVPFQGALDAGVGLFGQCGCTPGGTSCGAGKVCETRVQVIQSVLGGIGGQTPPLSLCLPDCRDGLDCAALGGVCNSSTGLCVDCQSDSDCAATPLTPACLTTTGAGVSVGVCGCTATSCTGGFTCTAPGKAGAQCVPACSVSSTGVDSCLYPTDSLSFGGTLCDTETGLCQQCFTDKDCAGRTEFNASYQIAPSAFCQTDGGYCVQCTNASQCDPFLAPGCAPPTGLCGTCETVGDCPAPNPDAGLVYACIPAGPYASSGAGQCFVPCVSGVTQCPALLPVCNPYEGACAQCLSSADCDGGTCIADFCR